MSSTATIELERLVAPISEISGAGEDLREDSSPISAYHTVKSARAAARNTERSAAQNGEAADSKTEWRPILAQTTELLSERSKDLELTAWFIEASVRLHGFAGLRDGFRLTRALLESFWDDCYPKPEGSDLEARVAPLTGLNGQDADGTLIVPIRNVALTEGQSVGPFAYWQYSQAVSLAHRRCGRARQACCVRRRYP